MSTGHKVRIRRLLGTAPGGAGAFSSRPGPRAALRWAEGALWVLALVAIGYLGYVGFDRVRFERQQTERLRELSLPVAAASAANGAPAAPAKARPAPANGELIGRLDIPGAGVSAIVIAGTDDLTLRRGVGHIDGTALPGEPGNVGLAGHRDTVFRGLRKLRPSDRILLVTPGGSFEYAVESLRTVSPEDNDVLAPSTQPTLTLVTCFPFDYIGPAPMRYIVRAREVGRPGLSAPVEAAAVRP